MPSKFRIKQYTPGGYYHIYNIGIDNRLIFLDDEDYQTFIAILRQYLLNDEHKLRPGFKKDKPSKEKRNIAMKLAGEVSLIAFCLMPNHFHLLLRQASADGIIKFMRRTCTSYAMYFNKKYHRRGNLFEGVYKAVLVEDPEQILHLSRFIHLNPVAKSVRRFGLVETKVGIAPEQYIYSSYGTYIGQQDMSMVDTQWISGMLKGEHYKTFMNKVEDLDTIKILNGITLDY